MRYRYEVFINIYGIIKSCLESSPKARPCFKDLEFSLESCGYLPVVFDEEHLGVDANTPYVNVEPK